MLYRFRLSLQPIRGRTRDANEFGYEWDCQVNLTNRSVYMTATSDQSHPEQDALVFQRREISFSIGAARYIAVGP